MIKIARIIGENEMLPNYYIELIQNQEKKVVCKIVYDKTTSQPLSVSKEEQLILNKMAKKEFRILKGEGFKSFIQGKISYLKQFDYLRRDDDDVRFLHYDILSNGVTNASLYCKDVKANIIFAYEKKDKKPEFASFTKEELNYPVNVYFLCKSTKELEKVNFYLNEGVDKNELLAVYRTPELFYVAELDYKRHEIINMEIYDVNYFANVTEKENIKDAMKIKEEIEAISLARRIVLDAKEFEDYFK